MIPTVTPDYPSGPFLNQEHHGSPSSQINLLHLLLAPPTSGECDVERATCHSPLNILHDEPALLGVNDAGVRDAHQCDDPVLLDNRLPVATRPSLDIGPYSQSGTPADRSIVSDNAFPVRGEGMTTVVTRPPEEPAVGTTLPMHLRILACCTMYGELSTASIPEDFAPIHMRMQQEWKFNGVFLLTLAAVNAAMFAITPDAIFKVNSYAYTAVSISSAACGLGIACNLWFLVRYNWVDAKIFILRSRDVYGSYVFFSLSSRMPTFCMLVSSFSLAAFLGFTAYDAWSVGVLVIAALVAVGMFLQFIVYGAHWFFKFWRAVTVSIFDVIRVLGKARGG